MSRLPRVGRSLTAVPLHGGRQSQALRILSCTDVELDASEGGFVRGKAYITGSRDMSSKQLAQPRATVQNF